MCTLEELSDYLRTELSSLDELRTHLQASAVISIELQKDLVYDLMVLMPDDLFEGSFRSRFGECFVVNDQVHSPPVFTRFKSYSWLRRDFARRLPIALWIFSRSIVIQDPEQVFARTLLEYRSKFSERTKEIIKQKYIEFRSDRHNLRHAVQRNDDVAIDLLRSNVAKLALEIVLLAADRPYPYKKWLSLEVETTLPGGLQLTGLLRSFLREDDPAKAIALSDEVVAYVMSVLSADKSFSASFLKDWWLQLA